MIAHHRFGVMLDSGCIVRTFRTRAQAKDWKVLHNARSRAARRAGELVYPRLAVALVVCKAPPPPHPIQSSGGKARAAKLSPERRSEIARAAARKRWDRPAGMKSEDVAGKTPVNRDLTETDG